MRTPRTRRRGRCLAIALGGLLVAATAEAQLIKVPTEAAARRPITLSASLGILQTQSRYDGQSGVSWYLGEAVQQRVTVDVGLRSGAFGVSYGQSAVPISRDGGSAVPGSDGHIQLRNYLVSFRSRETEGAHQIVELAGGLSRWADYRGTDPLTPEEARPRDAVTLVVGYGFGFTLGRRAALTLIQDYATLWGSGEGLSAGQTRSVRQYITRVGLRYRFTGDR
ncbi:MAG: hypothetical protein RL139_796 [Gemmatimonadota bacterium]|jgi:hypothetical protein